MPQACSAPTHLVYAAGSCGTILRNGDGQWQLEHPATDVTLQAIESAGSGIYACGSGGVVLRRHSA